MSKPLVSVICLCHNQSAFVQEALESVWGQTFKNYELIVVDDGSTDGSVAVIEGLIKDRPGVRFLQINDNTGNCKAFNKGLKLTKGEYIIDLAADDVLLPDRIAEGVKAMEAAGEGYAVHFTDALYIDVNGKELRTHYKRNKLGHLVEPVPQGWVYPDLLQRYFICTPSMMMRQSVLEALGGYDETLAYEDFDFWVRSSRSWKYFFTDKVLVKKRIVPRSWSARQYEKESRQLETTYAVCLKARELNRSKVEDQALGKRLSYEIRQAIRTSHFEMAKKMLVLKKEVSPFYPEDNVYQFLIRQQISFLGKKR